MFRYLGITLKEVCAKVKRVKGLDHECKMSSQKCSVFASIFYDLFINQDFLYLSIDQDLKWTEENQHGNSSVSAALRDSQ